jgi:hypothetical protein
MHMEAVGRPNVGDDCDVGGNPHYSLMDFYFLLVCREDDRIVKDFEPFIGQGTLLAAKWPKDQGLTFFIKILFSESLPDSVPPFLV